MGNELTRCHYPCLARQISDSSGKDKATIEEYVTLFQDKCLSGALTAEDFSRLYLKVILMCDVRDALISLCVVDTPNHAEYKWES